MLCGMDKQLREILHTLTTHFGGLYVIFCDNLFQAQPVLDSWIFEQPRSCNAIPYTFWRNHVTCFELKQVMRQDDKTFVSILNRIRTCSQIDNGIAYLNKHCCIQPPNDPTFPHPFHRNKYVQAHNNKMFSMLKLKTITLNAIDNRSEQFCKQENEFALYDSSQIAHAS